MFPDAQGAENACFYVFSDAQGAENACFYAFPDALDAENACFYVFPVKKPLYPVGGCTIAEKTLQDRILDV